MTDTQSYERFREHQRIDRQAIDEALQRSREYRRQALEHLASAKRHSEEFKRLERLRGVPLFWRY